MQTVPFATKKYMPWDLNQDWSPPRPHTCSECANWDAMLHKADTSVSAEGGCHRQTFQRATSVASSIPKTNMRKGLCQC